MSAVNLDISLDDMIKKDKPQAAGGKNKTFSKGGRKFKPRSSEPYSKKVRLPFLFDLFPDTLL
jgi:hypothetical protein